MRPRLRVLSLVGLAACFCVLGFASTVAAQQAVKIPRLGYISPGDIPPYDNGFLQVLQDQGYIMPGEIPRYDEAFWRSVVRRGYFAGQKIRIEVRATEGHFERAPELAAELVRLDVDVIFAVPAILAKAAQQAVQNANKSIPIVFGPEPDPVGFGLISSLARPGGNMTGLAWTTPELEPKRLQILKEAFPRITRVAYLTNPAWYPQLASSKFKSEMDAAARAMGIRLDTYEVNTLENVTNALAEINRRHTEAMVVSFSPLLATERRRIVDFVAKRRLPTIYGEAIFVEGGGLMFYGTRTVDWMSHAATLVAKILRGSNPADIPVEQPTNFKLIINLKTARSLHLTIPKEVLFRADQVIE